MWKYSTCRERIIILQKRHNCLTKGKKNVVGDICLLGKFNTTNPTSCNVLNKMKLSDISIFETYNYTKGYFKSLWKRKLSVPYLFYHHKLCFMLIMWEQIHQNFSFSIVLLCTDFYHKLWDLCSDKTKTFCGTKKEMPNLVL